MFCVGSGWSHSAVMGYQTKCRHPALGVLVHWALRRRLWTPEGHRSPVDTFGADGVSKSLEKESVHWPQLNQGDLSLTFCNTF